MNGRVKVVKAFTELVQRLREEEKLEVQDLIGGTLAFAETCLEGLIVAVPEGASRAAVREAIQEDVEEMQKRLEKFEPPPKFKSEQQGIWRKLA